MKPPIPPHPMHGVIQRLGVRINWLEMSPGDSVFLQGADDKVRSSVYVMAHRRGIKVRTQFKTEEGGHGLRVWVTA